MCWKACSDSDPRPSTASTLDPFATSSSSSEPRPSTPPAVLAVADCFDVDDFTPGAAISRTGIHVVDCAGPHQHEVYAVVVDPDGPQISYPSDEGIASVADDLCLSAFAPALGVGYQASTFDFATIRPDRAAWDAGERTIVCAVHDTDFQPLIGSHITTTTTTTIAPRTSTTESLASESG